MACKTFHGKKYFNIGKSWKPILYLDAFKCIHKTTQETLASFVVVSYFHPLSWPWERESSRACVVHIAKYILQRHCFNFYEFHSFIKFPHF